jgi:tetratricopeptide (TPR) repeat protein
MKIALYFILLAGLFFLGSLSCSKKAPHAFALFPDLCDSLPLEQSCMRVSRHLAAVFGDDDTSAFASFYHILDSTGNRLARSLGEKGKSPVAASAILSVVYADWGIEFDTRDTAPEALLPHLVYKTKKGSCLGVSLIILMLAKKVKCPVFGVMLPGHFFCRYENGTARFNIEPNKTGINHPDAYYKDRYPVASNPWYDLHNLSKQETIGMFCYNAGTICLERAKNDPAIFYCRQAMRLLNYFPEASGNCALAYFRKGDIDTSLALFKELFSQHPDFVNCAANYGTELIAAHQWKKAREVFKKGLEYFPEDTILQKGIKKVDEKACRAD